MNRALVLFALSFALCVFPTRSEAQCSDAGVCSIGGGEEQDHLLTFSTALSYGASSKEDLSFTDLHLGLQAAPREDVYLNISIPFRSMKGPLGSTSGIGDLLLAGRYSVWSTGDMFVSVEGGVRFATGPVNEGLLPQAYQPGLGTTDLLFGVLVMGDRWSASAGYQHAPGRSSNTVNQLRRGDDISMRGAYVFLEDDLIVRGEAILIHKLQTSEGRYPAPPASSLAFLTGSISNTNQTQINLVGDVSYPLTNTIMLNVRAAMAMLSRPVNIDGLKRNFTLQAGLSIPLL